MGISSPYAPKTGKICFGWMKEFPLPARKRLCWRNTEKWWMKSFFLFRRIIHPFQWMTMLLCRITFICCCKFIPTRTGGQWPINCGVIATGNDWILVRCAEHHPTIQTVVNQMKGAASKWAGFSLWQKGFYDHIVRNDGDYQEIIRYIQGNPAKWLEDKLYRMR